MGAFDFLLGDSKGPGALGTGQYQAPQYAVNRQAFQNPVGDQSQNWNSGMNNMLGATTGSAPQAKDVNLQGPAQIGATSLSGGAQIGPTATYGGSQLNGGQYNSTFGQEQGLANQLGAQAQGNGPSLAEVQAQKQAQSNMQQQAALLGSQRGSSNPALAQRAALDQGAAAQQQAAATAVAGRTQEELNAQQAQAGLLGAMNNQATNFAGTNAQLEQQAGLASMGAINTGNITQAQLGQQNNQFNAGTVNAQNLAQAQLNQQTALQQGQMNQQTNMGNLGAVQQQNQLNAQQYNEYLNNLQQMNLAQYQGQMGGEQLQVQNQNQNNTTNAQAYQNAAANRGGLVGGGIGALGAVAMFSDKRAKTKIRDAKGELSALLNLLAAF